ncbi:uncharacterized protein METZ01_LOCUS394455 [marine metagenome]|uniref:Lysozyme n=1 Tax=marine metagenome TaxID=408172 RepID=A0A382V6S4_9ZZZZ
MNSIVLKEQIKRHEGEVLEVYEDSLGYLTLGVGHLIREDDEEFGEPSGTPVSQEVVDRYYDTDFMKHVNETLHVCEDHDIDFDNLPENVQHVLINMCFNLGANRLGKFRNMLSACSESNWDEMAAQMEDSKWFGQVGRRSAELQEMVLNA